MNPLDILVNFSAIIISLTVHEFAHAWSANYMGDPTPARYGRLNLNPLTIIKAHPFGALIVPLIGAVNGFLIGWAATPVNPRLVSRKYTLRQAEFWISIAGPLSNLLLAVLSAVVFVLLSKMSLSGGEMNQSLEPVRHLSGVMVLTNIFLMLFNMIPVPPFDGFTVLASSAPRELSPLIRWIEERQQLVILFVFIFGGRMLSPLIYKFYDAIMSFTLALVG